MGMKKGIKEMVGGLLKEMANICAESGTELGKGKKNRQGVSQMRSESRDGRKRQ